LSEGEASTESAEEIQDLTGLDGPNVGVKAAAKPSALNDLLGPAMNNAEALTFAYF
jgi:hypothetical protein